ncbi:MAG: DUF302 domain-containing protein [Bacteroidota bacterium]
MNKQNIILLVIGIVAGVLLTSLFAYRSAPDMMLKESESKYDFEKSVEVFEQTAKDMGWKIPTVHDMAKTMDNSGYSVNSMKVFELCHPDHAYEILKLDEERIVSNMMPCRVSIYEKSDGKTYISWMNTSMMGNMMGGVVADVMGIASAESEEMIASIKK